LTTVVLTWTAPQNVTLTNYTVEWGTTYGVYTGSHSMGGTGTLTYTVTGLTQNTTYYFIIETWTASTTRGPYSNIAPAHTGSSQPPIVFPSVLSVSSTGLTSVVLTWTAPQNVTLTNYTVEWGTAYGIYTGSHSMGGSATLTYTVTGLTLNTTYYFVIETWTAATTRGPYSNIAPAHTASSAAPVVTPSVLSVSSTGLTTVVLTWTAPTNVSLTNYTVEWGTVYETYTGSHSMAGTGTLTYTVTGLTLNTTYYFVIETWTTSTTRGPYSNIAPAHTAASAAPVVTAPVLTASTFNYDAISLSWSAGTNFTAVNYSVEWGYVYGVYVGSASGGDVLYHIVTGLMQNETYYFLVQAWTGTTTRGPASNIAVARTSPPPPPTVVASVLSVVATGLTTAELTWTATQNVSLNNYTVEWGTVYGTYPHTFSFGNGGPFDYEVTGLSTNTTYYFVIETWTNNGVRGPYSNVAPAQTQAVGPPVVAPGVLSVSAVGVSSVTLTWTAPTNVTATSYTVEWGTTYGSYSGSASGVTALHYTVTGLSQNTTYFFLVVPNKGPTTNVAPAHTATVSSAAPPVVVAPVLSVVGINVSQVDLAWTVPQNVTYTEYQLLWGTIYGSWSGAVDLSTSTQHYSLGGLTANTTYYFIIVVTALLDSNIAVGHTTNELQVIVTPGVLSVAGSGDNAVNLTWTAPTNVSGITGYTVKWGVVFLTYTSSVGVGLAYVYQATGLLANTTYYFVVVPNVGPDSNIAVGHTLTPASSTHQPVVVVSVLAVVATTVNDVELAWSAPTNVSVSDYQVNWGTAYGSYPYSLPNTTALHEDVGALSANVTYYFVITTWVGSTPGPASNVAIAHTKDYAPSVPSNADIWGDIYLAVGLALFFILLIVAFLVIRSRQPRPLYNDMRYEG
jgi:hypothetical protein